MYILLKLYIYLLISQCYGPPIIAEIKGLRNIFILKWLGINVMVGNKK